MLSSYVININILWYHYGRNIKMSKGVRDLPILDWSNRVQWNKSLIYAFTSIFNDNYTSRLMVLSGYKYVL